MSVYGRCVCCSRPFRSKSSADRARNYRLIHEMLRAELSASRSPIPEKTERHREASETFRMTASQ